MVACSARESVSSHGERATNGVIPGENVYVGTFFVRSPPNLKTKLDTFGLGSGSTLPFDDVLGTPEELFSVMV